MITTFVSYLLGVLTGTILILIGFAMGFAEKRKDYIDKSTREEKRRLYDGHR